ncbi:hypothetical protein Ddc_17949 [Ditylenchus destructor]|nr:hypothetical protein Ddc_17949 [Ditylenchus destructor]
MVSSRVIFIFIMLLALGHVAKCVDPACNFCDVRSRDECLSTPICTSDEECCDKKFPTQEHDRSPSLCDACRLGHCKYELICHSNGCCK